MRDSDEGEPENLLTTKEAMVMFSVSQQRLSNWMRRGLLNRRTQERVLLKCVRVGGNIRITREAIEKFKASLDWYPRKIFS